MTSRLGLTGIRRVWRWLAPPLAAALLALVGWLAWQALPPGSTLDAVRSWPALAAASASYLLVLILLPLIWTGLLRGALPPGDPGNRIANADLYATYSRSWLARYIPGRIWTYGGRALLAARLGVPFAPVARSMVLEILFSYGMLTVLGLALLLWAGSGAALGLTALAGGMAALGLGVIALGRGVARLPGARAWPERLRALAPDGTERPQAVVWPIAAYLAHGALNLAFLLFISLAFVPLTGTQALHAAGAWGVAMTLGWLAFLAPGGLGARDGVALLLLAQVIDTPTAALIVATARLLSILIDFLFVGLVEASLLVRRLSRPAAAALITPQRETTP